MNNWTSQTVTDQLTSMLAERRRLTCDRRSAYLALARAISQHGSMTQQLRLLEPQPQVMGDRRGHAA